MPEEVTAPEGDEVVEGAEPTESAEVEAPEPYVLPDEFVTEIREWGGPEAVRSARELQQMLNTEEGQVDLMVHLLRNSGLGVKEIEYIFSDEFRLPDGRTPAQAVADGDDPREQVVTRADLEAERTKFEQTMAEQRQQFEIQQAMQTVTQTVNEYWAEKGIADADDRAILLELGSKILPDGDYDPGHIRSALEQAHTIWQARVEKAAKAYATQKYGQTKGAPTHIGGEGTTGGEGEETPNYADLRGGALAVAKQRVRDRFRETE